MNSDALQVTTNNVTPYPPNTVKNSEKAESEEIQEIIFNSGMKLGFTLLDRSPKMEKDEKYYKKIMERSQRNLMEDIINQKMLEREWTPSCRNVSHPGQGSGSGRFDVPGDAEIER